MPPAPAPGPPDAYQAAALIMGTQAQNAAESAERLALARVISAYPLAGWTTLSPHIADFTMAKGTTPLIEAVDVTAGPVTAYLPDIGNDNPPYPNQGEMHAVCDIKGLSAGMGHGLTLHGNGRLIVGRGFGSGPSLVIVTAYQLVRVVWNVQASVWFAEVN
jgi:hypothetical protein